MPELPPSTNRRKFISAAQRCGFAIVRKFGKGDHYKMYSPNRKESITVPKSFNTHVVRQSLAKFINAHGNLKKFLQEM